MQRLHVSQPSLSRQIRDLEEEMGVQLLERTPKSVRLTDAGRAFLDDARAILQQTDEAVKKARAIAGKGASELQIGDWPLATERIMPALLRAYRETMPDVRVKLHDWPVEQNIAGVRDGRLQLAILVPPLKANALDELRFEQLINYSGLPGGFMQSFLRAAAVGFAGRRGPRTVHRTHARGISPLPGIPVGDLRPRERQAADRGGTRRLVLCFFRRQRRHWRRDHLERVQSCVRRSDQTRAPDA